MALSISVTRTSKKINETHVPSFTKTYNNVLLKDPTSREHPVLIVKDDAFPKYNYMKFNDWYYWIDDIISLDAHRYEIHGSVDPLATAKSSIGGTKGMCNYGPQSLSDIKLTDPRFTADVIGYTGTAGDEVSEEFAIRDTSSGVVIIKIVSWSTTDGGIKTLCGDMTAFLTLLTNYAVAYSSEASGLQNLEKLMAMYMGFGNALDSIKSAVFLPIRQTDVATNNAYTGDIGGYPIAGTWYYAKDQYLQGPIEDTVNLNIDIPGVVESYPWLKGRNFLNIQLNTPGGLIDLSSNNIIYDTGHKLDFKCRLLASLNGDCALYIYRVVTTTSKKTEYELAGIQQWNWSIDLKNLLYKAKSAELLGAKAGVKLGMAAVSGLTNAGVLMSRSGEYMSEGAGIGTTPNVIGNKMYNAGQALEDVFLNPKSSPVASAITSGISGMVNSINMNEGTINLSGPNNITCLFANETKKTLHLLVVLWVPKIFMKKPDGGVGWELSKDNYESFCHDYGYPVFDYAEIKSYNGYSGYYQMAGVSVQANMPSAEISSINSFVNGGFYYN